MQDTSSLPPLPLPPDFPYALEEVREEMHIQMLKQRVALALVTEHTRFNQGQVAGFKSCSLSKVKADIKLKRLATLPSGWITRPALIDWLGFDPIADLTASICNIEAALRRLTKEIEGYLLAHPCGS